MRTAVLLVACVVVLVGAGIASRMLVSVEPEPAVEEPRQAPLLPAVAAREPGVVAEALAPVAAAVAAAPSAAGVRTEVALPSTPKPLALGVAPPAAPTAAPVDPPADEPESPFLGVSEELDYADRLLLEPDGGVERLESARDAYLRCLSLHPGLPRCVAGLTGARLRLDRPRTPTKGMDRTVSPNRLQIPQLKH